MISKTLHRKLKFEQHKSYWTLVCIRYIIVTCFVVLHFRRNSVHPRFSGVRSIRVARSLVLYVCFVDRCLSIFFWPLCCLFFLDLWILLTALVSSNSSYRNQQIYISSMKHDFYISFQYEHMTWYNCKSLDCPAGCYADNRDFSHSNDLTVACYRKLFSSLLIKTKPVVRGHHWDKEKLAS